MSTRNRNRKLRSVICKDVEYKWYVTKNSLAIFRQGRCVARTTPMAFVLSNDDHWCEREDGITPGKIARYIYNNVL